MAGKKITLCTIGLALAWGAVLGLDARALHITMSVPILVTLDAILASVTVLMGLVHILRGPGFYKSLKLGEAIGEQRERRRHRCPTATTTVPASRRAGATTG